MSQEILAQDQISASTAGWNTLLNDNTDNLQLYIKTFLIAITDPPGTGTTSTVTIQLQNAAGVTVEEAFFLRVNISNSGLITNATNATIAISGSTTTITTNTAGKDLLVKSSSAGLIELVVTDATDEIVTLNIGPSPIRPVFANYNNFTNIDFSS